MKLYAVFLGGRAKKCNTELHDVVFTCGNKIEETYFDLISKWFGIPDRLHIDSWVELSYIDGYKITLSQLKNNSNKKLYFINLGGYEPKKFEELHESKFMVGRDKKNIKRRAKESMLVGLEQVHTDDLYDVDDCIEINKVSNLYVNLIESKIKKELRFNNGYLPIPKKIIDQYKSLNGID